MNSAQTTTRPGDITEPSAWRAWVAELDSERRAWDKIESTMSTATIPEAALLVAESDAMQTLWDAYYSAATRRQEAQDIWLETVALADLQRRQ